MADSKDPRKFLTGNCPGNAAPQTRKASFFRTVGQIGDLEILNNVDNEIGQGLRALETISNQIRLGQGAPKDFSDSETSDEAGTDKVLEQVKIDPNQTRTEGLRFNPAVANRALGQANAIFERVRQGNYEVRDIPEAIQDLGNLKQLLGGIFTEDRINANPFCDPSPYAMDLIAYAPKHKFMFVVEFQFNDGFKEDYSHLNFAFVVKRTTRPNINFEYEDVNYYNFRSKVLKKSEFQNMTMTFYDDMKDQALKFYNEYLQSISPVARTGIDGHRALFEESGMTFTNKGDNAVNSASIQAVGDTTKTIIDYCQLYHIVQGGNNVDIYRFDNPRFQALQLDDLDMTDGGTGTEVTVEFNYDGLEIQPAEPMDSVMAKRITTLTEGGKFPIVPKLSGDEKTGTSNAERAATVRELSGG